MWTLTQLSPKTEMVGTFEIFADIKAKINELADGGFVFRIGRQDGEAVYFTLPDGSKYEAYNHG